MEEVKTPAKFNLFKLIFKAEADQTFNAFGAWLKKWVAIVNIVLVPLFRLMLILLMCYAVFFTYRYYSDLKAGNGFKYGAQQLELSAGSPVKCFCQTPKGSLEFNASYMSPIGFKPITVLEGPKTENIAFEPINLSKFTMPQIQSGEFDKG